MKRNVIATACRLLLVLGVVWAAGNSASGQQTGPNQCATGDYMVYDGFEAPLLDNNSFWRTDKLADGALQAVTNPVYAGQFAWSITVHQGDIANDAGTNERDEVQEQSNWETPELVPRQRTLHYYIPANFPQVDVRLVMTQWKQREDPSVIILCNHPVLVLRYRLGVMWINIQTNCNTNTDADRQTLWSTTAEMRGRWFTLAYRTLFDRTGTTGNHQVWLDGVQIINFHGITAYPTSWGYGPASAQTFYFKFGLYRDTQPNPWTAYFDDYWLCQSPF